MDRFRYLNLGTISGSESGNGPVKALPDKSRNLILTWVQLRMNCGKVPLRLLLARDNSFKVDIGEKLAYSGLVSLLFPKSNLIIIGSLLSW